MTNDDGRKPEGAPERSPKLAQGPLRALMEMAPSASRGERLDRQAQRVARACAQARLQP
jgi:hypothetical protein